MKKTILKALSCLLGAVLTASLAACGSTKKTEEPQETPAYEITPLVGEPLDYSNAENWMFLDNNDTEDHEVDVFFLYPTSVATTVETVVCENIEDMKQNAHVSYLQSADTLAGFTNVYAPYYRQLSAVGIMQNLDADKFVEAIRNNVTRTDAYAALDYYFENCNNGRPFILAGHSQGSFTLKLVLEEYMQLHPEYLERMIACYAIGAYYPQSWFDANPHIRKATGETDTGVLITWNTEGPGGTKFNLPIGNNDGFAINPLNWKTDETPADISLNKGSVFVNKNIAADVFNFVTSEDVAAEDINVDVAADAVRAIVTEITDGVADATVDLDRGVIVTTTYSAFIPDNPAFGDKSCHFEDWALYTMNIRENAQKRIAAYLGHEGK